MLVGRCLLISIFIMLWTFVSGVITIEDIPKIKTEQSKFNVIPIQTSDQIECHEACSADYCFKYSILNKNCTKFIRDQCDCCTVCLRNENEICGGRFNVYGICEQDLLCYKSNTIPDKNLYEQTGICVKGLNQFLFLFLFAFS
ncbi:unnamed protein product [Rotaria socialis]|uniref:IGFBP N-terminal domain-containing protein n=1 Tax=Rotaria socialis TaxID=392032 RepID=A0A820SII8_9BILA|nr:unnamed protein product [Rotaria socialis]